MLTSNGFSLIEILVSIALSSLIIMATTHFYPLLHNQMLQYYQQFRLEQTVQYALTGLIKDIKRAGFIANYPEKMTEKALEINNDKNCIMIRYDSESHGEWRYNPSNIKNSDLFTYSYSKNNLEYKTGAIDCNGSYWEKIFDPNEIEITQFLIKKNGDIIEINLKAVLKNKTSIFYDLTKVIKNENAF